MRRSSNVLINRLLSGGEGLSGPDKEQLLAELFRKLQSPRPQGWLRLPAMRWALVGLAPSCLAAALFFFYPTQSRLPLEQEFLARGQGRPSLAMSCTWEGAPSVCRIGARLLFRPSPGSGGARYFSALARREDQQTVWYFVSQTLTTGQLPHEGVLEKAALLSAEHGSGTFEVLALFSTTPLEKEQIREILQAPQPPPQVAVVRQHLVVEP